MVVKPLVKTCSNPAKVKSSAVMVRSIRAVYGALAISSAIVKIGFANPMSSANSALRATSCHGSSASVIGPPKTRKSCQTVMRNKIAHAVYCITSNAFETKGKYSSMVTMSVPSAFRNNPDTASISWEAMLATHEIIPSKIQSKITSHLRSVVLWFFLGLGILSTGNEGLQVRHDKAQSVQDNPGYNDALQPAGCLIHRPLITGNHPDNQCNCCNSYRHYGTDGNKLSIDVLHDSGKSIPNGFRHYRLQRQNHGAGNTHHGPISSMKTVLSGKKLL